MNDINILEDYFEKITDKIISGREIKIFYKIGKKMTSMIEDIKRIEALFGKIEV
jgi:hypothetical protein